VVLTGQVKVFKVSGKGDEQVLHHMGPSATFGEAAVLSGTNYPAFAEVLEEATLLVVSRSTLLSLISDSPELALGLLAGLSAKLHEFARLIEQLSLKEVPARLADILLELADSAGSDTFELDRTKRQLAAQIGTVPETLSRTLNKLANDRVIRVEGARITILARKALEELATSG
jgi:CRP/FNR family transcriptional regulator